MKNKTHLRDLVEEIDRLRTRLHESEETVDAIRSGAVDAVIVHGINGEQVFTLTGEEAIYRRLVETMNEAGLTLTPDGVVLFCNERFGEMVRQPMESIVGRPLQAFLERPSQQDFTMLLEQVQASPLRRRLVFRASDGTSVPARVSANLLQARDSLSVCLVATDTTAMEESQEVIRRIKEQQEALREAHQRLTLAIGAGRIGLFDWQIREEEVYYTAAHDTLFVAEASDGISTVLRSTKDASNFIHPDDLGRVREELERAMRERTAYRAENRVIRADGAVRWLDARGVCHYDAQGNATRMVGTLRDITDRKQAEEAMRRSEERLAAVMAQLTEGLIIADGEGRVIYWNPAALAIHGYASMDECRRRLADFADTFEGRPLDEDRPLPVEAWPMSRVLRGEVLRDYEMRLRRLDRGRENIAAYSGSLIRSAGGEMLAFLSITDITERKRAEKALRESEAYLKATLRGAADEIWMVDAHGRIVSISDSVMENMGVTSDKWADVEAAIDQLEIFSPDGTPRLREDNILPRALRGEVIKNEGEVVRNLATGRLCCREVSGAPIRDAQGRILGAVAVARDITQRKQAEEALRQSEESLRRLNETLEQQVRERIAELDLKNRQLHHRADQLSRLASELTLAEQRERHRLAKVLHDHLQQLLAAAKIGLQVLRESLEGQEHSRLLGNVCETINDCLAASRSLTVELAPTILHEAGLAAGLQWLARSMERKHGLSVDLRCQPDALAEREDIRILLFESVRELLFNVVKHAGVTSAKVELSRRDTSLKLVVGDQGVGFDPEHVRAAGADAPSGFGLFTIRERLELLGGSMIIETAPQRGAAFTLTAPAVYPPQAAEPQIEQPQPAQPHPPQLAAGTKLRILIVDDHSILRQAMAVRLKREPDIEIAGEAANGEEAVDRARQLRPDVILMDFSMPRMDGVEATRRIHAEHPCIRVVGLSMYEEADRARAMLAAGAAAYITKTANLDELLKVIRNAPVTE